MGMSPSSLQLGVGEIKYAPARDVVYLFPSVLMDIAGRLEDQKFKPLHAWLDNEGVTMEDLSAACGAYARFLNMAHHTDKTMEVAMEESGWFAVKWQARVAYMFYAGAMITGTFFRGIRDACPPEGDPVITKLSDLVASAQRMEAQAYLPAWMRSLVRRYKWLRRLLFAGLGIKPE